MPQYIGSSAVLGGAATFTSNWVNSNTWAAIGGTVFSDQSGTLFIEQSGDASHADGSTSVAVTGGTGTTFNVTLLAPYVRLRFLNGATPQTVFRLFPRFILGNST